MRDGRDPPSGARSRKVIASPTDAMEPVQEYLSGARDFVSFLFLCLSGTGPFQLSMAQHNVRLTVEASPSKNRVFIGRTKMKAIIAALSFSLLTIVIVSSFSSEAYARRGGMNGYDNTYSTTDACKAGACSVKKPKAKQTK